MTTSLNLFEGVSDFVLIVLLAALPMAVVGFIASSF